MLDVDRQRARRKGLSLGQIQALWEASGEVQFEGRNREDVCGWVEQILRRQGHRRRRFPARCTRADACGWTRSIRAIRTGPKGARHINAVDAATQWEVLGAAAQISEAWLEPVLEAA